VKTKTPPAALALIARGSAVRIGFSMKLGATNWVQQ
jgi:hypothetical protein